jgi:ferric-dicitrate binding protein FerR (iron transport regulator)
LKNTIEHIDELIGKYLAGEASSVERGQVEAWAMQSATNQKYLEDFRIIFKKAADVKVLHSFDEDVAWNKMKAKLGRETKVVSIDSAKPGLNLYYKIAASVIIILSAGLFIFKPFDKPTAHTVEFIAETKTVSNVLPEGSDVFLNKQTKLTYAYDKKKKEHVVKLEGEAYFKIKHEEEKNLIIDVAGIYIKDIGTSFNVKAYRDSNTVEVVVEEGEIVFYTDNDSGVHLHASAKGIYDKTARRFSIEKPEKNTLKNTLAYKTKIFSFDGTTLETVVNDLNSVYDEKIIIPDHLKQCRLTVDFANEDIDEITNIIAETLGLSVRRSKQEIFLEGTRCE